MRPRLTYPFQSGARHAERRQDGGEGDHDVREGRPGVHHVATLPPAQVGVGVRSQGWSKRRWRVGVKTIWRLASGLWHTWLKKESGIRIAAVARWDLHFMASSFRICGARLKKASNGEAEAQVGQL